MDLTAPEIRVLGCLLEKQRTTPDAYPLSLNTLRLACNQSTNRDPVVDYDEATIRDALQRLGRRRWTRLASGHSSRASKYRHLIDDALGLARDEQALLAVLMLRGAQTPGELKQRAERLEPFAGLDAVNAKLGRLIDRGLVARLGRRPGQKEERYEQRLGDGAEAGSPPPVPPPAEPPLRAGPEDRSLSPRAPAPGAEAPEDDRVARLEGEVAALRDEIAALRERLDAVGT